MKKLIFAIIIYFVSLNLFSQNSNKISGGLYIGTGFSWSASDFKQIEREGTKFNYGIGLTMDANIINNFAFSLSFGYYQLGTKFLYKHGGEELIFENSEIDKLKFISANSKIMYNMHNLELPIGFKGKTDEINLANLPFTFFLKASIVPMFNLKSFGNVKGIGLRDTVEISEKDYKKELITENICRFQLAWQLSGGMEMGISGSTRLLVEIFYTGGIVDIDKTKVYKNNNKDEALDMKVRMNNLGLKVGILF